MAENVMSKSPDPSEEEARRARVEARNAQAKIEAFRMQSLTLAVQWASGDNWSGSAAGVVGAAQVFEHYLTMGTPMGPATYSAVYQAVRDATDATRG
jgi:hypothetical protein